MHDHKKIEELQRENRALRRKIRMLEQQVSAVPEKPAETTGQYRAKNYFSYLLGCLREKSFLQPRSAPLNISAIRSGSPEF